MLGVPVLVEVLHGPARVARLIQRDHAQRLIHGHRTS